MLLFDILVPQHNKIIQCLITLLLEQFELLLEDENIFTETNDLYVISGLSLEWAPHVTPDPLFLFHFDFGVQSSTTLGPACHLEMWLILDHGNN